MPPPQPPRPKDPTQEIIDDMKQAFPNIEEKYIIATLIASQGNPDPAFNALLYISDPTFKPKIPVYKPPALASSTGPIGTGGGGRNQKELTDDELLARKLQRNLNWKMKETEEIEEDRLMKDRELNSKDKDNTVGDDDDELDDSPMNLNKLRKHLLKDLKKPKVL